MTLYIFFAFRNRVIFFKDVFDHIDDAVGADA